MSRLCAVLSPGFLSARPEGQGADSLGLPEWWGGNGRPALQVWFNTRF